MASRFLKYHFKKYIAFSCMLFWIVLFAGGLSGYPGSKLIYLLFSVTSLTMLASGLYRQVSYGYLFLVIFLWLGFWLKLTVHVIFQYPYVEPIGFFDGTVAAWDGVLGVAIVASIGLAMGRILYELVGRKSTMVIVKGGSGAPAWYPAVRKWLWLCILAVIVSIAVINAVYGILQIGLVPRTILPWPLNAAVAWMVSIGSAMGITTLIWWDIALNKDISLPIYAIITEASLSTVSMLSRGTYIFHALPQVFSQYKNRQDLLGFSRNKIIIFAIAFVGFFVVSVASVTTLRAYLYPHEGLTTKNQARLTRLEVLEGGIARVRRLIAQGEPQEDELHGLLEEQSNLGKNPLLPLPEGDLKISASGKGAPSDELVSEKPGSGKRPPVVNTTPNQFKTFFDASRLYQIADGYVSRTLLLAVDRWIGLEGVMAVRSYPAKGATFLLEAMKEKREIGKSTLYQEVCRSSYRWTDANTWQFASLPGAAAFLYYSGSLWVVMLGMLAFALLVLFSESLIFVLTANPLLCSLYGLTAANSVAQFGVAPRQAGPYFFMIFCGILAIWFVQSRLFFGLLQKLGLYKDGPV